jgi:membrane protein implicated in regulation of membrane protease activity
MGFLWNHWFWITLGLLVCVKIEASENLNQFEEVEGPVSLPAGARGGKALLLPEHYSDVNRFDLELGPTRRPTVSVSKSVSKVSVKRKVSVGSTNGLESLISSGGGLEALRKISDIYVDRGIRNGSPQPPGPRRIQPYYIGYNLVYREPEKYKRTGLPPPPPPQPAPAHLVLTHPPRRLPTPTNPNIGLLSTIIAKLKSLAEATSSRIRFSNLLKEPVLLTTESPSTTTPSTHLEELAGEPGEVQEKAQHQHVLVRIDDLGVTTGDEANFDIKDERVDRPRSLEARGRSLPFLDQLDVGSGEKTQELPSQDWEDGEDQHTLEEEEEAVEEAIKEIQEEEILEDVLEVEVLSAGEVNSDERIQQGDFIQDFTAPEFSFSGSEDVKISAERIDQSNISAVIGVILGIIIFVIISIVLVLLGVQRRHMKNVKSTEPAEDVISQASYMTYSTTVSDHSVNYGPANWEKDICEDLCSLDNDSFLNSLEAVTTTDYWGPDNHY